MKGLVGSFNQEKDLVGAFSVIVPVVEPMDRFTALVVTTVTVTGRMLLQKDRSAVFLRGAW